MTRGYVIIKQSEVSAFNIVLFNMSKVRLGLQYLGLLVDRSPTLNKFLCYYRPTLSQRTNLLCLAYFFLSLVWIIDYNFNNNEGKALIYYDKKILTYRVYQYGIMIHSALVHWAEKFSCLKSLGLAVSTAEVRSVHSAICIVHRSWHN